uniref:Putative trypsin-like peptidase domain containing protein n=1 Tax=viral metagenome TaxID=1070528 RepID=A0A6M3K5J6_9ZZZZ
MLKKIILLLFLVLSCSIVCGNEQEDLEVLSNAIVKVYCPNGNAGSGTLVWATETEGYVLTCRHVVEGNRSATAKWRDGYTSSGPIIITGQYYDSALFKVKPPPECIFIPIADPDTFAKQGTTVYAFGYGGQYNIPESQINLIKWESPVIDYKVDPLPDGREKSRIRLEVGAQSGDSGGPILSNHFIDFNKREYIGEWKVAGIVSGGELQGRNGPPKDTHGPYNMPLYNLVKHANPNIFDASRCGPNGCYPQRPILIRPGRRIPFPFRPLPNVIVQPTIPSPIPDQLVPVPSIPTPVVPTPEQPPTLPPVSPPCCDIIGKVNTNTAAIEDLRKQILGCVEIGKQISTINNQIQQITNIVSTNNDSLQKQIDDLESKIDSKLSVDDIKNNTELQDLLKGDSGEKGDTGDKGDRGDAGVAPTPQEIVEVIKNDSETIQLLKGDKGDRGEKGVKGDPGGPGEPGSTLPPSGISHMVLVADKKGDYWNRLSDQYEKAKTYYNQIRYKEPPTDQNIGVIPLLVAYSDGIPVKKFVGLRSVEETLSSIIRGEFNLISIEKE